MTNKVKVLAQGQIWRIMSKCGTLGEEYILAQCAPGMFVFINLSTGNRYTEPVKCDVLWDDQHKRHILSLDDLTKLSGELGQFVFCSDVTRIEQNEQNNCEDEDEDEDEKEDDCVYVDNGKITAYQLSR